MAVAPHHSEAVTADEMSISDRKPGHLTSGEPGLDEVASRATCRARARSTQLLEVKPTHLAVIEDDLNVGLAMNGDCGDLD